MGRKFRGSISPRIACQMSQLAVIHVPREIYKTLGTRREASLGGLDGTWEALLELKTRPAGLIGGACACTCHLFTTTLT